MRCFQPSAIMVYLITGLSLISMALVVGAFRVIALLARDATGSAAGRESSQADGDLGA